MIYWNTDGPKLSHKSMSLPKVELTKKVTPPKLMKYVFTLTNIFNIIEIKNCMEI